MNSTDKRKLKSTLERLYLTYDKKFLETDPIYYPHIVKKQDKEITAFISASLAYGRVAQIKASIEKVLDITNNSPLKYIKTMDVKKSLKDFKNFKHRFNDGKDMVCLLYFLKQMIEEQGTIKNFYKKGYDKGDDTIVPSLINFCENSLELNHGNIYGKNKSLPKSAGVRYFFPSPTRGSASKRLNMFLRWMIRTDEVDLGLWNFITTDKLIIPLDTHVSRISRYIGLTERKSNDLKTAIEITEHLKELDKKDPVKYDFAIARLGIIDKCPKKKDEIKCNECEIKGICIL